MIETTTFNDLGQITIREDGLQVIQVYDGDGSQTFANRYERPMWYTEVLFDHLAKHDGLGRYRDTIEFYRKSIARENADRAAFNVLEIRNTVRVRYRDQMHDCRVAAMTADQQWLMATDV